MMQSGVDTKSNPLSALKRSPETQHPPTIKACRYSFDQSAASSTRGEEMCTWIECCSATNWGRARSCLCDSDAPAR